MQRSWKLILCSMGLMGGLASAQAADDPFTLDKMLAEPDVMPAVNGCVKAHPRGNAVFVESIAPMNHGLVNIVTADTGGRRVNCIAELRSGKVSERAPLVESEGPLFVSAVGRKQAPAGECFTTKAVKSGKQLQGWLLTQNGQCGGTTWKGLAGKGK